MQFVSPKGLFTRLERLLLRRSNPRLQQRRGGVNARTYSGPQEGSSGNSACASGSSPGA